MTLHRRGTRYLFTTLLLLGILSCTPTIHLTDVAKLRMGMRPDEAPAVMGTPPTDVFQWELPGPGESISVQAYRLSTGEYTSSTYLLAYRKGSLIFWGYPHEFARSSDPFINEIGKEAVARQVKARSSGLSVEADPQADIRAAREAYRRGDYSKALQLIRPLAEKGIARAQSALGAMYLQGRGVPQNDAKALKWFRKAAKQGFAEAQLGLGVMYGSGRGVSQSYKEAAKWFGRAAKQGNAHAQHLLGLSYAEGRDVQQDYKEAAKWFGRAAEQGNTEAQYWLGRMYEEGLGVRKDYVLSYVWSSLAAAKGEKDSRERRDRLARKLTPEQIAEGKRLVREWKRKR